MRQFMSQQFKPCFGERSIFTFIEVYVAAVGESLSPQQLGHLNGILASVYANTAEVSPEIRFQAAADVLRQWVALSFSIA